MILYLAILRLLKKVTQFIGANMINFLKTKTLLNTNIESQYLDTVVAAKMQTRLWRSLAIVSASVAGILAISLALTSYQVVKNIDKVSAKLDKTRYILVPGLTQWTDVYPGTVSEDYISGLFKHIAIKMATWNYFNYEQNMADLYKLFFSPELTVRHKENLRLTKSLEKIASNKITSMFKIDEIMSEYRICEKLRAVCGYTSGTEYLYNDGQIYRQNKIAFFMIGEVVRPEKIKPYAITITRLHRSSVDHARTLLKAAMEGSLPNEQAQSDL